MDYVKIIEGLFEETKSDIIMISGGASCETMAQEAVLCYEQDKNIKLNHWVRMEIEGKLKNKLKAYFERKEQEKKDSKLKLDDIMTDEFGKFGTIIDKVAKVEEEHEEMLNEYMDGDEEKLFSETLDAIQALRSFLVYQCESVGIETVARYLADWTAKQENRKRKYLKNDKDSLCNICKYKNCWYGCESNSFQAKKITLCGKFAKKEEKQWNAK